MNLVKRDDGLDAVDDAAGGYGAEAGERVERGESAAFGAGFKAFAEEQKSDDEQDGVEVDIATGGGPDGGVGGVGKGDAGAEADEGVHVGGAVTQGAEGAEIDAAAGPADDEGGEHEKRPAQRNGR